MKFVLAPILLVAAFLPQRLGVRLNPTGGGGGGNLITANDVSFVGYIRMPTSVVDTQFAYGGMTARVVGGNLHFFVYGRHDGGFGAGIASGTSSTVFTVASGQGAGFTNGDKVAVTRGAIQQAVPEAVTISNVTGDVITVTPALGGTPALNDVVVRNSDLVYEIIDPAASACNTGAYTTTVSTSPHACNYALWGDVYHGRRTNWDAGGTMTNGGIYGANWPGHDWVPAAIHWNETTGMLYTCSSESYVTPNRFSCVGSTLDNVGTLASTAYGPWILSETNRDGVAQAGGYIWLNEGPSGELLHEVRSYFSGGPNLASATSCTNCTNGWPTTTTPGGPSSSTLTYNTRWVNYYSMTSGDASGNYWITADDATDGTLHGTFRSFTSSYKPTLMEPRVSGGEGNPRIDGDPTKNQYWGWTELDSQNGCMWVTGANKSGVLCAVTRVGSGSTSTSCTTDTSASGAHHWYVSANAPCSHGCLMGADFGISVTGPGANATWTGLAVFDPSDLTAQRDASGANDYSVVPTSVVDFTTSPYNVHVYTKSIQGGANQIKMGYYDTSRNYLFMLANLTDDSVGGVSTSLIYVFHISDSASPEPTFLSWLLSLAPNIIDGRQAKNLIPSLLARPR